MANGPSWPVYRTVVLDPSAQTFVDDKSEHVDRFEEQWRGIEWLISRTPEVGRPRSMHVPTDFVLLVVARNEIAGTNDVWLLYSYSDAEVTIHGVRFG